MDIVCHMFAFVLFLWNPLSISANCPDPFAQAEGICLYVSSHRGTGLKTWADARAHCLSIGGDLLASPPNYDELKKFLRTYTSNRSLKNGGLCNGIFCRSADRWMGSSRNAESSWQWLSGSSEIPWQSPWPNQHSMRPACLVLAPWDGRYKDDACDSRKAYLCAPKKTIGHLQPSSTSKAPLSTSKAPSSTSRTPSLNSKATCGQSTRIDERIVSVRITGGRPAITGQYPFMVHFTYFSSFHDRNTHCGGTLISSRWVLTAAHCFKHLKSHIDVFVKIGFVDLRRQENEALVFSINLDDIETHPGFNPVTLENDIALVHLPNEVTLGRVITTICLGTNQLIAFGGKATAAGWGLHTPSDDDIPNVLHDVELDVVNETSCTSPDHFICTYTAGKDTCRGDSGGPLMVLQDRQWYQIGIVSHGPTDCGTSTLPAHYTRVPNYLAFISNIISF